MSATTKQVIDLLDSLVRIESISPWLVPGGSGEQQIARFIASWLADYPVEVEVVEVAPGRPNVIARLRGSGGGRTLCFNAHTDTVGHGSWQPGQALVPRVAGNRLYGLGASDDKSGCAAAMLALDTIVRSGARLTDDLLLAFVADAEGLSIGTEYLVGQAAAGHPGTSHCGIDAAIVIEPQPVSHLVIEHQGFGWIDLITRGVAAHGSAQEIGVDAIVHMAEVVTRLHHLDRTKNPSLLNGRAVFHTATISGGTDYATYPDYARLGIKIGTQPGEHLSDRIAEIEAIFADVATAEPGFNGEIEVKLNREPFVAQGHERLQAVVVSAMQEVLGSRPVVTGLNAWRDAALMQAAGIPTLLMGSTGGNQHAAQEWTSIGDIIMLSEILSRAALTYLR